jgi:hypothetical protein
MFGDAMFDEEDRLRRAEAGQDPDDPTIAEDEAEDLLAAGGLDERLRRRQALTQLLREVGGV